MKTLNVVVLVLVAVLASVAPVSAQSYDCTRTDTTSGFTLLCSTTTTQDDGANDIRISNVVKRNVTIDTSHWVHYTVTGLRQTTIPRFRLTVRLYWLDGTHTNCSDRIGPLEQNQSERELVIPSNCGTDAEWGAVEFVSPSTLTCDGCNVRYRAGDVPFGSSLQPEAAGDPAELDRMIDEIRFRYDEAQRNGR